MALGIDWDDVALLAPELASLDEDAQDLILGMVDAQLSEDWEDLRDTAALYLAAHLGALTKRGGSAGAVQSESVGQVSRTYAVSMAAGAGLYGSTVYGQEYERLAKTQSVFRFAMG